MWTWINNVKDWLVSAKSWLVSLFGNNADDVRVVLTTAAELIDKALPIVESLDNGLKQDLQKDPADRHAIIAEVTKLAGDESVKDGVEVANKVVGLTIGEILSTVAIYLLGKQVPSGVPERMLRLVIELAYNVYKLRKGA
jgi:hypothetical protein